MEQIQILMTKERRGIGNESENLRIMGRVANQSQNLLRNSKLDLDSFF